MAKEKSKDMTMQEVLVAAVKKNNNIYKDLEIGDVVAICLNDDIVLTVEKEGDADVPGFCQMTITGMRSIRINANLVGDECDSI